VLALVVCLVLAVWGLLRLRAVSRAQTCHAQAEDARADRMGDAPRAPSPHAERRSLRQMISRDAVRRSPSFASRAPDPLCERIHVSNGRFKRTGVRARWPARRSVRRVLHAGDASCVRAPSGG
jgi:hypothetical protein